MSIILNITAFIICIIWFQRRMNSESKKLILPVVLTYLLSALLAFIISFFVESEYLDGIIYLVIAGISILIFWIWTTIVIIMKNVKSSSQKHIVGDLAQNTILIVVPLLLWLWISNMSLKIGG